MEQDERIDPEALRNALLPSLFATKILHHQATGSTNALAKELALKGAPEGTLVVAEEQTAGRGRRGRTWSSPAGTNLLVSILLRPTLDPEQVFVLTMVLALVTVQVVERMTGVSARIKWPNDLYVGNRKLAGILTEFGMRGTSLDYVILGIGINVNWHPPLVEGMGRPATSLLAESGRRFSGNELLLGILKALEASYRKVLKGEIEDFYREWNALSLILGLPVVVESDFDTIHGKALRIDEQGALIIEQGDGAKRRILCGEVSLFIKDEPR